MTGAASPAPYSKKGERWVNHTVQPGLYVVNDPRPPPPPPAYQKPTGQRWARRGAENASPGPSLPNPYAITRAPGPPLPSPQQAQPGPPPAPPPPPPPAPAIPGPAPIPQAFQTPKGKTPRFYDPDDFRKFTETHGNASVASYQPTYTTPVTDSQGRSLLPIVGDTSKRGPYAERMTRAEETELLAICLRMKETYGAPSTQNKWWITVAADFNVYRRKNGRNDVQPPTGKRRVELALAKRKKELGEDLESDEPQSYLEKLDEWVEHIEKLEKGEIQALGSKAAAEAKLEAEMERIKKEREQAEKDYPLAAVPPSSSASTPTGPAPTSAGADNSNPVQISDSPARDTPPQPAQSDPPPQPNAPPSDPQHGPPPGPTHHGYPPHPGPHGYPPPSGPLTHHGAAPPPGPYGMLVPSGPYAPPGPYGPGPYGFAPPPGFHGPPQPPPSADYRPAKRQRTDDGERSQTEETMSAIAKLGPALDSMNKLANEMLEWRKTEREAKEKAQQEETPADGDADMNGTADSLFSPAPVAGDAARIDELERRLREQAEANEALTAKLDDVTIKITQFAEEATTAESREKDRDKKMDKILQVLKKHFQGTGATSTS